MEKLLLTVDWNSWTDYPIYLSIFTHKPSLLIWHCCCIIVGFIITTTTSPSVLHHRRRRCLFFLHYTLLPNVLNVFYYYYSLSPPRTLALDVLTLMHWLAPPAWREKACQTITILHVVLSCRCCFVDLFMDIVNNLQCLHINQFLDQSQ